MSIILKLERFLRRDLWLPDLETLRGWAAFYTRMLRLVVVAISDFRDGALVRLDAAFAGAEDLVVRDDRVPLPPEQDSGVRSVGDPITRHRVVLPKLQAVVLQNNDIADILRRMQPRWQRYCGSLHRSGWRLRRTSLHPSAHCRGQSRRKYGSAR